MKESAISEHKESFYSQDQSRVNIESSKVAIIDSYVPERTASEASILTNASAKQLPMTKHQRIQAFFEPQKIYPTLQNEVTIDEEFTEFFMFRKHFLIMSEAGKPIYTRYGDEEVLSPFFATISAIITKFQSYFVTVPERI